MTEFTFFRGPRALRQALDSVPLRTCVRAPHHTASTVSLLGTVTPTSDGSSFRPGELSLAGLGVLMLDDFPEFRLETIEAVGIALRDGCLRFKLQGSGQWLRVPVGPMRVLMTATNCPCGVESRCVCTIQARRRWSRRIDKLQALLQGAKPTPWKGETDDA